MAAHRLGAKVRALRRRQRITQSDLAQRLGISASYLNLIEHNHRALSADLLVKLANILPIDLKSLAGAQESRTITELLEVFGDPLFDSADITAPDINELANLHPAAATAVIRLYEAFCTARKSAHDLAEILSKDAALKGIYSARFPSEEVSDLIQHHMNYFPELEHGAEAVRHDANLKATSLFDGLVDYLRQQRGVEVRVEPINRMNSATRRYDPTHRVLLLSEGLRRSRRHFQLAYQIGLLTQAHIIDRIVADPVLTTSESRASCRVALANYFAAAVLMPYTAFLEAAQRDRYDIELLGHRFETSFEQSCHRLATLRQPGAEGIRFHMLRVDIAGNLSKRFSASGLQIPRFSGACPRWNTFGAFLTPGMIRTQLSQMPDGQVFFGVARTVREESGGFSAPRPQYAIGLGCDISEASAMVYADGLNLTKRSAVVPVGPSCRLCERMDCEQRAYPPLNHPFPVDENRRGISFYAPPPPLK
jgi:predicted transcriptional regulator/transcriptional regulator with XRE-family HTH domain